MTVGELKESLLGVGDHVPVMMLVGEYDIREYLQERYWKHMPKLAQWFIRRWDACFLFGMYVKAHCAWESAPNGYPTRVQFVIRTDTPLIGFASQECWAFPPDRQLSDGRRGKETELDRWRDRP
jgi:hypothetical protein